MNKTLRFYLTIVFVFMAFSTPQPVYAAGIIVNTNADNLTDDGLCTLREAIVNANNNTATHDDCTAGSGDDTITFDLSSCPCIITVTSTLIINSTITITGTGASNLTISGGDTNRVFLVGGTAALNLSQLTITGGSSPAGNGGGILINSNGTLNVSQSVITGNSAGDGAGIYSNGGILTLLNSTVSNNTATGSGGGIYANNPGPVPTTTITNTTITGNSASGVGIAIVNGGPMNIRNSTIANNTAGGGANAIFYAGAGTITLWNTIVANSSCNSAVINGGNNIDSGTTCGFGSANDSQSSTDPLLGTLTGSPAYFPLNFDSPAINAGDNTICAAAPVNNASQNGVPRPQNGICDIGSYESKIQPGPTLIVNSDADTDDGFCDAYIADLSDCTLREAITYANNLSGTDTITFADDYTITLDGSQLPAINSSIIITGNGAANTIIEASDCNPVTVVCTHDYRVFEVGAAGDLTLESLTVRHGNCSGGCVSVANSGGGILNVGTLTLTNVTLSGNAASERGGGMYNWNSSLTLTGVIISANSAEIGGGIANENSNPTLVDVDFNANTAGDYGGGMLNIFSSSPTLTDVTFSGNSATNNGGGMYNWNNSNPTLTRVTFSNNSALNGGGMYNTNNSSPSLTNVTFNENPATTAGGGMYNNSSNPTLENVTFSTNSANFGGGMYNNSSNLTLENVTFSTNSANFGGGMYNDSSSPTLTNATFSDNDATEGGGMFNNGSNPTLTNVTFSVNTASNAGGGIFNTNSSSPLLTNATFQENQSAAGGGMFNRSNSNPTLTNLTFSGNTASDLGGGMYNYFSSPELMNVTFSGNTANLAGGGGIHNESSNPVLTNAILWENGTEMTNDGSIPVISYSVIQDSGGSASWDTTLGTDGGNNLDANPLLGALANNGGSTQTMALLPGSPAIDAGDEASCPETDQRGVARPQGAACDIGAYEVVTFNKTAPGNGSTGQSLSPTLSWSSFAGATSYEYCYSSAPGPCTRWNSVGTNTSVTLSGLAPDYTYHWQVRAITPNETVEANAGEWWSFTTTDVSACTWDPYTQPGSSSFTDVQMSWATWDWIERMKNAGITQGCGAGVYCPLNSVSREHMAIFLLRSKYCGSGYTPPAVNGDTGFLDVQTGWATAPWIKQLAADGVTQGCGSGNFCPLDPVSRQHMAIFLLRAMHGGSYSPPGLNGGSSGFADVETGWVTAPWIKQLAAEGVTQGCGGGNYCPLDAVSRQHMAIFLVRAFNLP